jgi:hypothetical protein
VHRDYDEAWILNDVALLRLEAPTDLPRQKLAGGGPSLLPSGTMATVVGWGRTKGDAPSSNSPVLLQASLPIASKSACDAFRGSTKWPKPGRPIGEADFCAGYGADESPMHCNGDSGGPLFVTSSTGEPIQAGIVSFVQGACKTTYGAYVSVGHFQAWISKRVPKAVFVMPQPGVASAPLGAIAGVAPGGPPSPLGQCAVDVYADGVATNTAKVGSALAVKVTSGIGGRLVVFVSRASGEKVVQIFPNRFGAAASAVQAGDVVGIGDSSDSFTLTVSPPTGRYAVIAIVMPETSSLASLADRFADMTPIEGFGSVLSKLAQEAQQLPSDSHRAVCTRQFDVE